MYDGIEVDVLSLADADCTVVTQWTSSSAFGGFVPFRILIDGGSDGDAKYVIDFLRGHGYTNFWAAVCTHPHKDHAGGLIKVIRERSISIVNGWMHDIQKHVPADTLRRASASDDGVKEAVETTKELASAFASRNITPMEPFAGARIAFIPDMAVLGPSLPFYSGVVRKAANIEAHPTLPGVLPLSLAAFAFGAQRPRVLPPLGQVGLPVRHSNLLPLVSPPFTPSKPILPPIPPVGVLSRSRIKESPSTQPLNNSSVILGTIFGGRRLLFTGDAGSNALAYVSSDWNRLLYMGVPHHGSDGNLSKQDVERFAPEFAAISACGDSTHPSRAVVSGLVKVGSKVASTHKSGNLWFYAGRVPYRADYGPAQLLEGTGRPEPVFY
jgi:beta-lactamase superfamily II metal-dependent hydrolase